MQTEHSTKCDKERNNAKAKQIKLETPMSVHCVYIYCIAGMYIFHML